MERLNELGKNAPPCTGSEEFETNIRVSPLPVEVTQLFVIVGNYEEGQVKSEFEVIADKVDLEVSDIDVKADVMQSAPVVSELSSS